MGGDDDIAASLPRPPLPAPARREAAIVEALRRFDGLEPARAAEDRRAARPVPWWSPQRRPYAGALAGAFLVALIGLPFAWTSFDRTGPDGGRERPPAAEAPGPEAMADSDVSAIGHAPSGSQAGTPPAAADEIPGGAPAEPATARRTGEGPVGSSEEPAADSAAQDSGDVVVTGSRIRHPDLTSASPVTVVGGDDNITVTGARSAAPRRRGDWNACTIDDPGRSLAACRKLADPAAKGASGRAAAKVGEGVSSAWEGDLDSAIASFDRAIELAPRSSDAYLNRALAWRRRGDLDRALADLDRAVRYSPRGARFYYHRSLVLRQRGDKLRARADEERAVALDPRYGVAVRGGE